MLIRLTKYALTFLIISLSFSCEDLNTIFVNCDECYVNKPELADISVSFTINEENQFVYFEIFEGTPENGLLVYGGYSTVEEEIFTFETGKSYSVRAYYNSKGQEIIVVDGKKLDVSLDKSSCSSECYIITGDKLDGRLRY